VFLSDGSSKAPQKIVLQSFYQKNDKKPKTGFLVPRFLFIAFLGEGRKKNHEANIGYRKTNLTSVLFWPLTHPPTTGVTGLFGGPLVHSPLSSAKGIERKPLAIDSTAEIDVKSYT
jgi:hypothetical protein